MRPLQNLTTEQYKLFVTIWLNPNMKAKTIQFHTGLTPRLIRKYVHQIRLKSMLTINGENYYLIADNDGYKIERIGTVRYNAWKRRFSNTAKNMISIVNVMPSDQMDLFN